MSNVVKKEIVGDKREGFSAEKNEKAARTAGIIAAAVLLLIILYWIFGKEEKKIIPQTALERPVLPSAEELLQPVHKAVAENGREFYSFLKSAIWMFASGRFGLSGSEMSKQGLSAKMNEKIADPALTKQLQQVLEICEAGMFTKASLAESREGLLQQTKEVFEKTDEALL